MKYRMPQLIIEPRNMGLGQKRTILVLGAPINGGCNPLATETSTDPATTGVGKRNMDPQNGQRLRKSHLGLLLGARHEYNQGEFIHSYGASLFILELDLHPKIELYTY